MITYQDIVHASDVLKGGIFPRYFWDELLQSRAENELLRQLLYVFPPKNYQSIELKTKDFLLFKQKEALMIDSHDEAFEIGRQDASNFFDDYYTKNEIDEDHLINKIQKLLLTESEDLKDYFSFIIQLFYQVSDSGKPLYSRKTIFIAILDYILKIKSSEEQTEAYRLFINSLEECRTSYPITDASRPFYPKQYTCMGGLIDSLLIKFNAYLDSLEYKENSEDKIFVSEESIYVGLIYQKFIKFNEYKGREPTDLLYYIYHEAVNDLESQIDESESQILFELKSDIQTDEMKEAYLIARKSYLEGLLKKSDFDSVQEKLNTLNELRKFLKVDHQKQLVRPLEFIGDDLFIQLLNEEFEQSLKFSIEQGSIPASLLISYVPEFFDSIIMIESNKRSRFSKYEYLHEKRLLEIMSEKSGLSVEHLKLILDILGQGHLTLEGFYQADYQPTVSKEEVLEELMLIKENLILLGKNLLRNQCAKYHHLMLLDQEMLFEISNNNIKEIVSLYPDYIVQKVVFNEKSEIKESYRAQYVIENLLNLFFQKGHVQSVYQLLKNYPILINHCHRLIGELASHARLGFLNKFFELIVADVEMHLEQEYDLLSYNNDWLRLLLNIALRLKKVEKVTYLLNDDLVTQLDCYGLTPLHWAIHLDQTDVLKKMITQLPMAFIKTNNKETLAHYAVLSKNITALKYLNEIGVLSFQLNERDNDNFTPIMNAILESLHQFYHHPEYQSWSPDELTHYEDEVLAPINYLIEAGADLNIKDARGYNLLMIAVEQMSSMKYYRLLEILLKHRSKIDGDLNYQTNQEETVLSLAINQKNYKLVHYLLRKGANPLLVHPNLEIPLEIQKLLLQAGSKSMPAAGSFFTNILEILDKKEQIYYLSMSLFQKNYLRAKFILNRLYIEPSNQEDKNLIFMIAQHGTPDLMDILLERTGEWAGLLYIEGDQIDRRDSDGKTCLHYASSQNNILMLKHLLSRYLSNPTLIDDNGLLPEDYCEDVGCKDLLMKARIGYQQGFFESIHNFADAIIFSPMRIYHKKNNQTVDEFCQEHELAFDSSGWPFFFKV